MICLNNLTRYFRSQIEIIRNTSWNSILPKLAALLPVFFSAGMTFRNGLRWTLKTFSSTTLHKREQRILSFRNWYASTISRDIFDHSLKAYKISWKSNQVLRYIWPYCAFINWSAYHYSFDIGKDCNTTDCGHSVALQK